MKRCFKPVVEVKVRRLKNGFTLKFIALRLQVVKVGCYLKLKWFEAVKYKIVLMKLLSHFLKQIVQGKLKQLKKLQEEMRRS